MLETQMRTSAGMEVPRFLIPFSVFSCAAALGSGSGLFFLFGSSLRDGGGLGSPPRNTPPLAGPTSCPTPRLRAPSKAAARGGSWGSPADAATAAKDDPQ